MSCRAVRAKKRLIFRGVPFSGKGHPFFAVVQVGQQNSPPSRILGNPRGSTSVIVSLLIWCPEVALDKENQLQQVHAIVQDCYYNATTVRVSLNSTGNQSQDLMNSEPFADPTANGGWSTENMEEADS